MFKNNANLPIIEAYSMDLFGEDKHHSESMKQLPVSKPKYLSKNKSPKIKIKIKNQVKNKIKNKSVLKIKSEQVNTKQVTL